MKQSSIIEMKNIHKSFYSVEVLKGVDFDLRAGEIMRLWVRMGQEIDLN